MADLKDFAEQLVNLSVKDVNELANILKEEYGIEPAAAAVAVAGPASAGGGDAGGRQCDAGEGLAAAHRQPRFQNERRQGRRHVQQHTDAAACQSSWQ